MATWTSLKTHTSACAHEECMSECDTESCLFFWCVLCATLTLDFPLLWIVFLSQLAVSLDRVCQPCSEFNCPHVQNVAVYGVKWAQCTLSTRTYIDVPHGVAHARSSEEKNCCPCHQQLKDPRCLNQHVLVSSSPVSQTGSGVTYPQKQSSRSFGTAHPHPHPHTGPSASKQNNKNGQ